MSFDGIAFLNFKFHLFDQWYTDEDFPESATTKKAECFGFKIESTSWITETIPPSAVRFKLLVIPYWSFTIPLTLLSAYLILWKPQKVK